MTNVHHLEERPMKNFCRENEPITFTEEDARKVHYPHNDPLVVTVQIGNMLVHRTLIDNGSSMDILYLSALEKMGLGV